MTFSTQPIQVEIFSTPQPAPVVQTLSPHQSPGRVQYQATHWPAKFYHTDCPLTVKPGAQVLVVGREGITLLVIPEGYVSPAELKNLKPSRRTWQDLRLA